MKLNKKEREVLDLITTSARSGAAWFEAYKSKTNYRIEIWGRGRAKALISLILKIEKAIED
jgi:hypothetical protein